MKYSKKFTVEISMSEFYTYAKSLVDRKLLHKEIKTELMHTWYGITEGEWGGTALDWKEIFYYNLWKNGIIEQTQKSIDDFGEFELY